MAGGHRHQPASSCKLSPPASSSPFDPRRRPVVADGLAPYIDGRVHHQAHITPRSVGHEPPGMFTEADSVADGVAPYID